MLFKTLILFPDVSFSEKKKKKKSKVKDLGEVQTKTAFALEPSEEKPKLDASQWPLLLKVNIVVSPLTKILVLILLPINLCLLLLKKNCCSDFNFFKNF